MFVLIHMVTQLLISLIQGQRETNSFLRKKHHWAHIVNMFIYKTLKPLISTSFFKILKNFISPTLDCRSLEISQRCHRYYLHSIEDIELKSTVDLRYIQTEITWANIDATHITQGLCLLSTIFLLTSKKQVRNQDKE